MRRQIAALAAGITLGFATTAASAQQLTEIKISYQPALYWALPFYVAEQKGWYAEVGYDVLATRSSQSLVPFVRYERWNTQDQVPAGFSTEPTLSASSSR